MTTLKSLAGKNGYYELLSSKNFLDKDKRISLRVINSKGDIIFVGCSTTISNDLRNTNTSEELINKLKNLGKLPLRFHNNIIAL